VVILRVARPSVVVLWLHVLNFSALCIAVVASLVVLYVPIVELKVKWYSVVCLEGI
jgi:hypothetical protein